jgi:hypothetical protein
VISRIVPVAIILLLGCSEGQSPQRFAGVWEFSAVEHNRFREEGRTYANGWGWCIAPGGDRLFEVDESNTMRNGVYNVVFEGVISPPAEHGYGHMGLCEREITVTRVVSSEWTGELPSN